MGRDVDPLADAFLDKLMAERNEAERIAQEREAEERGTQAANLDDRVAQVADKPVPKSALFRLIEEKGEVTDKDIHELVSKEVRRGI